MSTPFRFMIAVEQNRNFEITGWGDDASEALRDALCSNTTALGNHFAMGDRGGFLRDDLCIEEDGEADGGYRISFHPRNGANGHDGCESDAWAIRAISAV